MNITVITPKNRQTLPGLPDVNLKDFLAANGYFIPAACGGRGTCGKCAVNVISGTFSGTEPDGTRRILACRAKLLGDAEIYLSQENEIHLEGHTEPAPFFDAAVDIGTTTLCAALVRNGKAEVTASCQNPQAAYGADVLSRIQASTEGSTLQLSCLVRTAISSLLQALLSSCGAIAFRKVTIAGNTTMLHLLLAIDPTPIGRYPFTPVFIEEKQLSGEALGFPCVSCILLPSIGPYVGADITAGIVAIDLCKPGEKNLLMDLGTNGELALWAGDRLLCTSTAAGPCLEGAGISCGMGGLPGAIQRVTPAGIFTIDNAPARGICGSGLIDLISVLLNKGAIDETGAMEEPFALTETVSLTPSDVRSFQLAKAAIRAGTEALLHAASLTPQDLQHVFVAGSLGFYIQPNSAVRTGLLPPGLPLSSPGNTSLNGAVLALTGTAPFSTVAAQAELFELSTDPYFNEQFIQQMLFL